MPMPPYRVNDATALELLRNLVAGFSFGGGISLWKPKLIVVLDNIGVVQVKACISVPHRETGAMVEITNEFRLPLEHLGRLSMFGSMEAEIFGRVRALLFELIAHERDESILWQGKVFSDPHIKQRRYGLDK